MTTVKFISLTDRVETLVKEYLACDITIAKITDRLIAGYVYPDEIQTLTDARARKEAIVEQLKLIERIALDILSNKEFTNYSHYVSAILSPL